MAALFSVRACKDVCCVFSLFESILKLIYKSKIAISRVADSWDKADENEQANIRNLSISRKRREEK